MSTAGVVGPHPSPEHSAGSYSAPQHLRLAQVGNTPRHRPSRHSPQCKPTPHFSSAQCTFSDDSPLPKYLDETDQQSRSELSRKRENPEGHRSKLQRKLFKWDSTDFSSGGKNLTLFSCVRRSGKPFTVMKRCFPVHSSIPKENSLNRRLISSRKDPGTRCHHLIPLLAVRGCDGRADPLQA